MFWVLKNARFQLLRDERLENNVQSALTEAKKKPREAETPEEKQRRRNRQKGDNDKRREKVVNRLVYGAQKKQQQHHWIANLARTVRYRIDSAFLDLDGHSYNARQGLAALRKASM